MAPDYVSPYGLGFRWGPARSGRLVGLLHNAAGGGALPPGSNRIGVGAAVPRLLRSP